MVVLAACGRFEFDRTPTRDAVTDVSTDVMGDAPEPGLLVHLSMDDDPSDGELLDSASGRAAVQTSHSMRARS